MAERTLAELGATQPIRPERTLAELGATQPIRRQSLADLINLFPIPEEMQWDDNRRYSGDERWDHLPFSTNFEDRRGEHKVVRPDWDKPEMIQMFNGLSIQDIYRMSRGVRPIRPEVQGALPEPWVELP